jgi:Protein of unknown function (DUF3179)
VWERTINGRVLTFRLFGINNQNFIMRDNETGSWWQQVSGEAIHGPLQGSRLKRVVHDEISFGIWRSEESRGRVLRRDKEVEEDYADWNWEKRMKKVRTVVAKAKGDPLEPRAVIVGVVRNGQARAYPIPRLKAQNPVVDKLGGESIVVVLGDDKKSVRVFKAQSGDRALSLLRKDEPGPIRLVDAETGSEWDFAGEAVAGPLAGSRLEKVYALKEYWFDWKIYNPSTSVYNLGPATGN